MRKLLLSALLLSAFTWPALAETIETRRARGDDVIATLNQGQPQPALEALRRDFPALANAVTDYALGDIWSRPGLDARTRQLATVAAFAATGNRAQMKVHAAYALNIGVTPEELKEIVYLTTVHAGFPRAIDAAVTLSELFAERRTLAGAAMAQPASQTQEDRPVADQRFVGMWVTQDGYIRHELLPNGRYDEARGNRKSAYQGRHTITGNHIDYVDDTGFTADGDFVDGVLHHGGMIFRRE